MQKSTDFKYKNWKIERKWRECRKVVIDTTKIKQNINATNYPKCLDNRLDLMRWFAEIFGEWSEKYKEFKWQKLTTCAAYYNYEFMAHDSLEDCKATLYCLEAMFDQIENEV